MIFFTFEEFSSAGLHFNSVVHSKSVFKDQYISENLNNCKTFEARCREKLIPTLYNYLKC